jgi:hypothetical protein
MLASELAGRYVGAGESGKQTMRPAGDKKAWSARQKSRESKS